MKKTDEKRRNSVSLLKKLFIAGFIFQIIYFFMPSVRIRTVIGYYEVASLSEITQKLFNLNPDIASIVILILVACIALVVLAIFYPRRWVFLFGAILSAFCLFCPLLFGLFRLFSSGEYQSVFSPKTEPQIKLFFVPIMLYFTGVILSLTGFFIKPKKQSSD